MWPNEDMDPVSPIQRIRSDSAPHLVCHSEDPCSNERGSKLLDRNFNTGSVISGQLATGNVSVRAFLRKRHGLYQNIQGQLVLALAEVACRSTAPMPCTYF
jgi:hypothetical protein